MTLVISTMAVPLTADEDNNIRVSGTRVTLDSVIGTFKRGSTAEEIVQQYPTLGLADVYAVLSYYLRHTDEVENYLQQQKQAAATVRQKIEARFDPSGDKERLLARRSSSNQ